MAGASIDAIGVINQIKDNLTDRYDNGFPVLKEIIQNADDAGAQSLTIGWSMGFSDAENELLNAPAIFFINDAPLEEEHRDAILSIAQSSKATSKSSVGKFGLGMKSLFHMGEAFFFLSDKWRLETWASDVFNPWDKYRKEWNYFSSKDKNRIVVRLESFLQQDKPWFIVWVPLRTRSLVARYDNLMIINNVSSSDALPEFFTQSHLSEKTSEILPQLKNLIHIGFYGEAECEEFKEVTTIQLLDGSTRSHFNGEPLLSNGETVASYSGKIQSGIENSKCVLDYTGCESIIRDNRLMLLKTEDMGWPKSYQFDKNACIPIEALDKAEQHSAVTFSRFKTEGQAYLRANWAVFLPLAQTDELLSVPIDGEYDYNLYLHGYFFVDAGRKGLHGHDKLGYPASLEHVKNDEKKLREVWNVILASEGTFRLVLTSLNEFCQKLRLSHSTKTVLTKALFELLGGTYRKEVSKKSNWIIRVSEEGPSWALLDDLTQCLPIPKPSNGDYSRIWSTLPMLKRLLGEIPLYEVCGYEFLTEDNKRYGWSLDVISRVIKGGVIEAFSKTIYIDYLADFLQTAGKQVVKDELDDLLIPLYRDALKYKSLTELSSNKGVIARLFSIVSPSKTVVLPLDKNDQNIWNAITELFPSKLLLPSFLESESKPEYYTLAELELLSLLSIIDSYLVKNEVMLTSQDSNTCDRIITFAINIVGANPTVDVTSFYKKSSHLKIFKVDAIGSRRKIKYCSLNELKKLKEQRQLFLRVGERDFGKGFGQELFAVTPNTELYFIGKTPHLPELYEGLTGCSESACLRLLSTYPDLGTKIARRELIIQLSSEFTSNDEKRGFRYLIHGSKDDTLQETLWKPNKSTTQVWMKLWRKCQDTELPTWCELDLEFTSLLRNQHEHFIGIREQNYKDIIKEYRNTLTSCSFEDFESWEVEQLLADIGSEGEKYLWQSLPLHLTTQNKRIAISSKCLMEGCVDVPEEWAVYIIKQSAINEVAACQNKWVNQGRPVELIHIALSQAEPSKYAELILKLLISVSNNNEVLNTELEYKLNNTQWLRIKGNKNVAALEDVLLISPQAFPVAFNLCESSNTNVYTFSQLDDAIFEQQGSREFLLRKVSKNKNRICSRLLAEAAKIYTYAIGKLTVISAPMIEQVTRFTELSQKFPGWALIVELYQNQHLDLSESKQMMLCNDINAETIFWALEHIADNDTHGDTKDLRIALLEALCISKGGTDYLRKLRFLNQDGKYAPGNNVVVNVSQVVPEQLISPAEFSVIERYCHNSLSPVTERQISSTIEFSSANAAVLKDYFEPWEGAVPLDAIATFLALFAKDNDVEKLVDNYLNHTTLEAIKEQFHAKWSPVCRLAGPYSGMPYNTLHKSVDFKLSICAENSAFMTSIFGERIQVKLQKRPDSLVIYQASNLKTKKIELRRVDTKNTNKDQLIKLLAGAVETIFGEVFGAQGIRFESDFVKRFGSSEQVDIQITRQIVLENVVPLLERLQVREEGLCELRSDFKREQRVLVSADPALIQNRNRINAVLKKIKDSLEKNHKVQSLVLEAVRKEMRKHFQYSPFSVPFELFQNADDALAELIEMQGENFEIIPKFYLTKDDDGTLNFAHWGREVNYCKSSFVAGKNRFDRDLEKMVSLNVSDKSDGKTGKFGLGFKSSLLLTDSPRIVSGDICAEIQAGVLPSIPEKTVVTELNRHVDAHTIDNRRPTLIQLPSNHRHKVDLEAILERFRSNAGILAIFSRHIREINIDGHRFEWNGQPIESVPAVVVGEVKLPTNTTDDRRVNLRSNKVVVINTKSGQFLFALGPKGFTSLEDRKNLSSFWVLNPIDEDLKLGFCINASFAVDIGRSQLAVDNDENIQLAKALGRELAKELAHLFMASSSNWDSFAEYLGLSQHCSFETFWTTLWDTLSTQWPGRLTEFNSKAELIKQMFVCQGGLLDFYSENSALPCKLSKQRHQFTKFKLVDTCATKLLTEAFDTLSEHPKLDDLQITGRLIGHEISEFLARINANVNNRTLMRLDLVNIIEQDCPNNQVSPDKAMFYGNVFGKNFEDIMLKFNATMSEKKALEERLAEMMFLNQTDVYLKASNLIVKGDPEYNLITKFAPASAKLSEKYNQAAIDLVTFAKRDSTYNIHAWAKQIQSNDRAKGGGQDSLCSFLVEGGNLAQNLSNKLRTDHPAFLRKDQFDPKILTDEWHWEVSKTSLFINVWLDTDEDRRRHVQQAQKEFVPNVSNSEQILENISSWWSNCREEKLAEYDKLLYAQPLPWKAMAEDLALESIEARKGWLKLFYLGCCQTIGRSSDATNRRVVAWFEENGWWDKLAQEGGPRLDVWKELMEEYLQTALVDERYRIWIQILPLYRFATKLNDYVELFMNSPFIDNLDDLLKPNCSNKLSGSGIQVSELRGTLGIGVNFILRELYRHQALEGEHCSTLDKHCFVLPARLRRLLSKMGVAIGAEASPENSEVVYDYLATSAVHLSHALLRDFDIPFRIGLDESSKNGFRQCFDFDVEELSEEVYG